jgi:type I restriction enzyme M protein
MSSTAARFDLAQYYTTARIGDLLLSLMSPSKPGVVLDLGVGDGALSIAAYRRWGAIDLITVDIDRKSQAKLPFRIPRAVHHRHILADVLAIDLPAQLGIAVGRVSTALCNPPYRKLKFRRSFSAILEDAGLKSAVGTNEEIAADLVFLAQNLRLVRRGGQIGLIVPDSVIAGERLAPLRSALVGDHRVECVVKLPSGSFTGTEAKAHLLVIAKQVRPTSGISLYKLYGDGSVSTPLSVTPDQATDRLDYDYHAFRTSGQAGEAVMFLRDTNPHIVRGSIDSAEAKRRNDVLHLSHLAKLSSDHRLHLAGTLPHAGDLTPLKNDCVRACTGDILIARVGRQLEHNVYLVESGTMAITDCIYRVRVSAEWRDVVFRALLSRSGQAFLRSIKHGAGAQYVCKRDLEGLPLSFRRGKRNV